MSGGIPESLRARRDNGIAADDQRGDRKSPPPRGSNGAAAQRAKSRKVGPVRRLLAHGEHHLQALFNTLGRMANTPFSTLMTVAVIGIALALPTGLHVVLQNAQQVSQGWEDAAQISLFLRKDLGADEISAFADEIEAIPTVAGVTIITPDQALEEFQRLSGFGDVLDALQENPLPPLLIVRPGAESASPAEIEALLHRFNGRAEVDVAQLDMEWIERLYAIMEIGKRAVLVLAVLLGLAVLLIIGNTIRLAIQSRREEIVVQKLIGATNGFIRRPFLYSGFMYGLSGAVFAWLLVTGSLWLLNDPVQRLSRLYNSPFEIDAIGLVIIGTLLLTGVLLGLLGAWLAVGRHLRDIEPS